jgi:hypothetical protein
MVTPGGVNVFLPSSGDGVLGWCHPAGLFSRFNCRASFGFVSESSGVELKATFYAV